MDMVFTYRPNARVWHGQVVYEPTPDPDVTQAQSQSTAAQGSVARSPVAWDMQILSSDPDSDEVPEEYTTPTDEDSPLPSFREYLHMPLG